MVAFRLCVGVNFFASWIRGASDVVLYEWSTSNKFAYPPPFVSAVWLMAFPADVDGSEWQAGAEEECPSRGVMQLKKISFSSLSRPTRFTSSKVRVNSYEVVRDYVLGEISLEHPSEKSCFQFPRQRRMAFDRHRRW